MCGIAGSIGSDMPDSFRVQATLSQMRNRGPDYEGVHSDKIGNKLLTLLHSRLAIIDLDPRSHQPFVDEDCVLVFNGEIYNYLELKSKLESLGHYFHTSSDTEIIIKSYRQFGKDCVKLFEGMWAFALFDKRKNILILSRDRFGEKPLYYANWDGELYFGSEVKFIATLAGRRPTVNNDQIKKYLVNGYKSLYKKPNTFFSDIYEIPPASVVVLKDEIVSKPINYYQISYTPRSISLDEIVDETRELLISSLQIRMRSDVPIAFCLSGGVDSTALASIASKKLGKDIHAFTIIDKDDRYDETENVRTTIKHLGCEHHIARTSTDGFFERLQKLVDYHDSPVSTISYYVHSYLSEEIANRGFKVALSGTGADEIFTGYYDHYSFWLAQMYSDEDFPDFLNDWQTSFGKYVRNPILKDPLVFKKNPSERRHIYADNNYFNQMLTYPITETFSEKTYSKDILRNRMLNELFHEVVPVILHEDDLNSMCWSVENRSPYLDSKLVKHLFSVPSQDLIKKGFTKWILRESVKKWAPKRVCWDKQKRGFNTSILSLIDVNDDRTKEKLLSESAIFDLIKRDKFEKFLKEDMKSNNNSKFLFSFISAKLFLETELINNFH